MSEELKKELKELMGDAIDTLEFHIGSSHSITDEAEDDLLKRLNDFYKLNLCH